jgi:hypothetical protein
MRLATLRICKAALLRELGAYAEARVLFERSAY